MVVVIVFVSSLTMLGAYAIMAFVEWGLPHFDWTAFRIAAGTSLLVGFVLGLLLQFLLGGDSDAE